MEATLRNHDVDRQVEGLFAIERELRTLLDARLSKHGLTYSQFSVLRFISQPFDPSGKPLGRCPNSTEVADHFGFAKRTVTVTVNALVKKGHVHRVTCASDLRVKALSLRPDGARKLAEALSTYYPINRIFHHPSRQTEIAVANEIPRLLHRIRQLQRAESIRSRN